MPQRGEVALDVWGKEDVYDDIQQNENNEEEKGKDELRAHMEALFTHNLK